MKESAAYTYRLNERGDLYLGGDIPECEAPALYPHYEHRDSVLRVVALPGTRIPRAAFSGYKNLRVAELSEAVSIAPEAFSDCPMLSAVELSPRAVMIAPNAFLHCPRLFCIDYVGSRHALDTLLSEVLLPKELLIFRTLPDSGRVVDSGVIGEAEWTLDDAGVLTVGGADVPSLAPGAQAPWHAHADRIRHLVIGEGVGRIGERTFGAMSNLTALTVVGDTEISDFAFASCTSLCHIDLFCAVTRLGMCSLAGIGARELMLPPSLRVIPEGLLQSAYALKTLVLPLLPARAEAPFLEHCEALSLIKLLAPEMDRRALGAALMLPRRTKVLCVDPADNRPEGADEVFRTAEHAIQFAVASYGTAEEVCRRAGEYIPRVLPVIDATENDHLLLERTRFAPDTVTVDPTLEKMSYKRRVRIMKEREKDRKEELKRVEGDTERAFKRLFSAFLDFHAALSRAADACKREAKDIATAERRIVEAERRIDGLYPFDGMYRARAAALRETLATLDAALPPDILPNALVAISEHKMLIDYRRFDDLRASCARVRLLLDEWRTDEADAPAERRVPPCILVAGGDPTDDRSAAACIAALRRAGAIVERVSDEDNIKSDRQYDALLLCDGDTHLSAYGGFSHGLRMDDERARRESKLFSAFFLYGKPIMGIGRGAQQINLYLAGTMRWNLNTTERETHAARDGKPRTHTITVTPDSALSQTYDLGRMPLRVFSAHTSAIRTLGRELVPIAKSHDGVVEAFVHRRVPLIGVQFALDRMLSDAPAGFVYPAPAVDDGMPLFSAFVELARRVRERPPVAGTEDRYSKGNI